MSYQSFGLRREYAAAVLARRNPASPATFTSTTRSTSPIRARSCVTVMSRAANPVPRRLAAPSFSHSVKWKVAGRLVVHVGEQFELDHHSGCDALRDPPPDPLGVGLELGVAERLFEPAGVDSPARDLKVDLHVNISGSGVTEHAVSTEQFGDEPAKQNELRTGSIMMHHPYKGRLCRCSSFAGPRWLIGHCTPPPSARRLPRRARQARADRRRHVAREQRRALRSACGSLWSSRSAWAAR